ncbi:MAG: hypothetical protein IKP76_00550 [Bacilli bacterium]|nr:hypothetical protein [Bacilli bacterium]
MKSNGIKGVIQLILSVVLYFLIDNYLFWLLGKIGIHFTGDLYMIASFVKYLVICLFIYLIYRPQIHSSKNKFVKSLLVSGIFAVGTAVLLVFVNFLLHRLIGTFHVVGGYGFINYFDQAVSINTILSVIINVILIPFIVISIFPLGVSNVIKSPIGAALIAGLLYGLIYALNLHTSIENAFWLTVVPALIMALITYIHKTAQNIWMVYISYILYVGLGTFVLRYFV